MSSYSISPKLKPNRVFILQKSELENRYDPSWYVYLQSIQGFKHKKVAFKSLLLNNPQYGANEIGINRETNIEPRYIRITDINEFGELENVLGKTASTIEEKYFLQENDLLLARSGNTVGKSYLHKNKGYDCFFAGYMIRFKIDETKVLPKYIFAYTQTELYKKWVKAIQRTTGQPNINAEEYRSLEIPLPDKKIQEKVIETYFDFISQKQTNEAEAEKLLASIDDYLLKELEITLPTPPENMLKNRMFTTTIKGISGKRLDPFYHQIKFTETINSIQKSKFKKGLIQHLIIDLKNGIEVREYVEVGIRYLRVTDLTKNGINNKSPKFVASDNEIPDRIKLSADCILVSRSGSLGLVNIVDNETINSILSSHIFKLELNTKLVLPIYMEAFLRSTIGQIQIFRNNNGGVIPEINQDALKSIIVVVPPIDKQKEIAEHITNIRNQAQALKDKTKDLLKKASEEIEEILLK
ncbi:MAG: restriction endonuclease subunit S [Cytophagales bacterium]|nr:MAG: restriction endonuclease subunit S [Cytophagales bacterium]